MTDGRRLVVRALGRDPLDALARTTALQPMERPDPAALAPDEVLVAVRAAAVGWVDLLMSCGQYQHVPETPYTPGMEWAGEVEAVGAAVEGLRPGDRVLADGFRTGPRTAGAHRRHGGMATWTLAPAEALLPLPEGLSFAEAACLLGSYETAWHCLVHRAGLRAGETALILGATGATGLAAVHVGKRVGATVIAAGRSPEKLDEVRAEGADHVLSGPPDTLAAAVKALTGGRGADVVFDGVGGPLSTEAMRAAAFGARYCVVGWAATPTAGRGDTPPNALPSNLILMKGLSVLGCPTVIATARDPSIRTERLATLLRWVGDGMRPKVARIWPLEAFDEAFRAKWEGRYVGGVVLSP